MDAGSQRTPLKLGLHRSVFRDAPAEGGPERVVKCFRARGRLRRLLDRRRARREERLLARLAALGLPVPAPLGVRRGSAGWELWCEQIAGAVSLEELVEGRVPWPRPPRELAIALGELLARARMLGLDDPDLHLGNLVVDGAGSIWMIDVAKARLLGRPRLKDPDRDLVRLEAAARERLPASLRLRCLRSWLRATGAADREAELSLRIASLGRLERRRRLRREGDRWLRESSRCERIELGGQALLLRRGAAPPEAPLLRLLAHGSDGEELLDTGSPARRRVLLRRGGGTREDWLELGRAVDHHLPAARPLAWSQSARSRALFELDPGACRIVPRSPRHPALDEPATLRAAGWLAGALLDRGLRLASAPMASLLLSSKGGLTLGPGTRLLPGEGGSEEELRALVDACAGDRAAAFDLGLRKALRGDPHLRRRKPLAAAP